MRRRCGVHVPSRLTGVAAGSVFDIDVPANGVRIAVQDAASGEPVAGAKTLLRISATLDGKPYPMTKSGGASDARGQATVEGIPPRHQVTACAFHDEYERACSDPFEVGASETKTAVVRLRKQATTRGHITSSHPLDRSVLFWSNAAGVATEMTVVNADGSFAFHQPHAADEHLVLAGVSHPLAVLPLPRPTPDGTLEIAVPQAPVRNVTITTVAPVDENVLLAMSVNGMAVPDGALSRHQVFRGASATVIERGPTVISDVLATGPITIVHGPGALRLPPNQRTVAAACALPEWRAACVAMTVSGDGRITFDR
jgi:hypothetical protein